METLQSDVQALAAPAPRRTPGVLQLWSPAGPCCVPTSIAGAVVVGRETADLALDDARVSRAHCRVGFDGALWTVEDLGSRNGTFIDGLRVHEPALLGLDQVLRVGHCLFVPCEDVRLFAGHVVDAGDVIAGPRLRVALDEVERRARQREHLVLVGASGSGKRFAATQCFRVPGEGPTVTVTAADLAGPRPDLQLLAAAEQAGGGALVLDALDVLDLAGQRALLTLCERDDPRLCVLVRHNLREAVRDGRLREDLYFRLSAAQLELPALVERREEIGFHVARVLSRTPPRRPAQVNVVERCLRLRWPGNVRELLAAVRAAALAAQQDGADMVELRHLDTHVGEQVSRPAAAASTPIVSADRLADTAAVEAALAAEGGNVRAAARALGVHRNQLRRWLTRHHPRADEPI